MSLLTNYIPPSGFQLQYNTQPYDNRLAVEHHDHYEIYIYESGNITYCVEDMQYEMVHGDVIIIPPGKMHRPFIVRRRSAPYVRYLLNLRPFYIRSLSTDGPDIFSEFRCAYHEHGYVAHFPFAEFERLKGLLEWMYSLGDAEDPWSKAERDSCLKVFFFRLIHQLKIAPKEAVHMKNDKVVPMIKYINDHLTEPITISDLTDLCRVSPSYTTHKFKEYTGLSVYEYIVSKRIALAKKLISAGVPIMDAQKQCGIKDYSNFLKAFVRLTGMKPNEYRKMCAPKEEEILSAQHDDAPSI